MNNINKSKNNTPRYIPKDKIKEINVCIKHNGTHPYAEQNITTNDGGEYIRICSPIICAVTDKKTGKGKMGPTDWQVAGANYIKELCKRQINQDNK